MGKLTVRYAPRRGTAENKRNSGFTLVEMLLTTAILVILLGLSMVAVVRWRDPLKITELDNAAREIYMAAENRSVLLQGSGAAAARLSSSGSKLPFFYVDDEGKPVTVTPDDEDKYVKMTPVVLSNDDIGDMLPAGSIEPKLWDGHFYVLYDEKTHHVFEVFYAEEEFSKDTLDALRDKSRSERIRLFRRVEGNNINCLVGYYGGGLVDRSELKYLPKPGVEVLIENGNQLTLTVKYTMPADLPAGVTVTREPTVTLEYTDKNRKDGDNNPLPDKTFTVDLLSSERLTNNISITDITNPMSAEYTWVLDSLDYKKADGTAVRQRFKDLFSAGELPQAFGGDFTVTARLKLSADGYIGSDNEAGPEKKKDWNSLFAEGSSDETIYIKNLRHLQNLDTVYSGAAKKTAAVQLVDIDCKDYIGNDEITKLVEDYEFIPIENWDLSVYYAGPGETAYSIKHLKVTEASADTPSTGGADKPKKSAGLFYAVNSGFTFKNVRLINSYVEGTAQVGGLVGEGSNLTFDTCRLEDVTVTHPSGKWYWGYCGGLVGYWYTDSTATFRDCEVNNLTVKSSSADAGGLAGGGSKATFTGCTVTGGIVTGGRNVGGMLGYEDGGGTFSKCRVSDAKVICTKADVGGTGGMVGSVKGTGELYANFDGCTAEKVTVTGYTYAGGLVGLSATESHKDEFINCTTLNANVTADNWNGDAGGLVGRSTGAQFKNCTTTASVVKGQYSAGGLVGNSTRGTFTGCKAINATAGPTSVDGASGGMVGTTESGVTIEDCRVYWRDSLWQKDQYPIAGAVAGGLTGKVIGEGTIKNSFAATGVSGNIYAGGLVGQLVPEIITDKEGNEIEDKGSIVTVTTSYADCYIRTVPIHLSSGELTTWSTAGGLIGMRQRKTVELTLSDVYAAGFITGDGEIAGGLIGGSVEGNIAAQNAYAAMHYQFNFIADYGGTLGGAIYPLAAALAWGQGVNCYWWNYPDLECVNNWDSSWWKKEDMDYNQMSAPAFVTTMGGAFEKKEAVDPDVDKTKWSHPYNLDKGSRVKYDFPGLAGLPHYGDWPTS